MKPGDKRAFAPGRILKIQATSLFSTKLEYWANRARQAHKSTPVVKGNVGKKCDIILVFAFGIDVEDGTFPGLPRTISLRLKTLILMKFGRLT